MTMTLRAYIAEVLSAVKLSDAEEVAFDIGVTSTGSFLVVDDSSSNRIQFTVRTGRP